MWDNAEVVALVDEQGVVRSISRNEAEAPIKDALGKSILNRVHPDSRGEAEAALRSARAGDEAEFLVAAIADDGRTFWCRARVIRSPLNEQWVLIHARRLPQAWALLSRREQDVVRYLHDAALNPKKAARMLGISLNTLNVHRRAISRKCKLEGIGDFWVFVERCR